MLLSYYLAVLAILGCWYAVYGRWKRRVEADIAEGAQVEYAVLKRKDPDLISDLSEGEFGKIFRSVEMPGSPIHTFAAVAIFLLGAPLVLALTALVITFLEVTGVIPQPAEQAQQLRFSAEGLRIVRQADLDTLQYILQGWGGFFTFFALLLFWVITFTLVMRRYHKGRPGSLREEILRAR